MKPFGRSLRDFGNLLPAEKLLLDCCRKGALAKIGLDTPVEATDENLVRATFVRFLALGGDLEAPVHENGVQLKGAYIRGMLKLVATQVPMPLELRTCFLERKLWLNDAKFEHSLIFYGSTLHGVEAKRIRINGFLSLKKVQSYGAIVLDEAQVQGQLSCSGSMFDGQDSWGLSGDGIVCTGAIHLSDGFVAKGGVNLLAAQIGSELNCAAGSFEANKHEAIKADRCLVEGSVFMRNGFTAVGEVRMLGARIVGQMDCTDGVFMGQGNSINMDSASVGGAIILKGKFRAHGCLVLSGLKVGGNLIVRAAERIDALSASGISISGRLVLRDLTVPIGSVSLAGGRAGSLDDDRQSWGENLNLNGFVYSFIHVHAQMSIEDRLQWLGSQRADSKKKDVPIEFHPQPWRQLQSVLDDMGHTEEARQVGIEFEKRLRREGLVGQGPVRWSWWRRGFYKYLMTSLHVLYGVLTAYGYRPMLLLRWFFMVWAFCSAFYWWAANDQRVFAPSNPLVFQNPAYESCDPTLTRSGQVAPGTGNWYLCPALPEAYTGVSPMAFSLDLLLPLVDLHQENDWAPLIETPKANVQDELLGFFSVKRLVRFTMWLEILAGWGFSLLFVAVISGLARRKE